MSLRVVAIIQARLHSTRLPSKVILPLGGKPLIYRLLERVQRATCIDSIVLAAPCESDQSNSLSAVCDALDVKYFERCDIDPNDLVSRYLAAAEFHEADIIIRIPGDNPCVDPALIDQLVKNYLYRCDVFSSNTTAPVLGRWIDGVGGELYPLSTMQWLDQRAETDREHPHDYFYARCVSEHQYGLFPPCDYHVDVNTQADYEYVKDIFEHLPDNFTSEQLVTYLEDTHGRRRRQTSLEDAGIVPGSQ